MEVSTYIFRPSKVQKHIRINIYDALDLPRLLHGGKKWIIKAKEKTKIVGAEMRLWYEQWNTLARTTTKKKKRAY